MKYLIIFVAAFSLTSFAQERYIMSPNQEMMLLQKGDNGGDKIQSTKNLNNTSDEKCPDHCKFGCEPRTYGWDPTFHFRITCNDVIGTWFIPCNSGRIDTFLFIIGDTIGAVDSMVYIRIHQSNLYAGHCPTYPPYPRPCVPWGYYYDANNQMSGIAPFKEDATDTTWISTMPGTILSFPPADSEIFGMGVGYGVKIKDGFNKVYLGNFGEPPTVIAGKPIFISIRTRPTFNPLDCWDGPTTIFNVQGWEMPPDKSGWGTFVFYNHAIEGWPSCGYTAPSSGWWARTDGPPHWLCYVSRYSNEGPQFIHYDINVPPAIPTLSTNDIKIQSEITDCDFEKPESAGVASATLRWWKAKTRASGMEYQQQVDIPMTQAAVQDVWEGYIPAQKPGTTIRYQILSKDIRGMETEDSVSEFKVFKLNTNYYYVDTGYAYIPKDISGSGTEIPSIDFHGNEYGTNHGTAGPFDLGGSFRFFGDTSYRYVWIGMQGAIALCRNPTDTIDINANGNFSMDWDIPMLQQHGRGDPTRVSLLPPNLIAPCYSDIDYAEDYSHVRYGDCGDPNLFIVEWESFWSRPYGVDNTFRVILNRADGAIEFQYDQINSAFINRATLVGMQQDSTIFSGPEPGYEFVFKSRSSPWYYVNAGGPSETRPRSNYCIKFLPGAPLYANEGWNLLSVPYNRPGDMDSIYQNTISDAFIYSDGYKSIQQPLANGMGFWMKFSRLTYAGTCGYPIDSLDIPVSTGWNMIGTISKPVPVDNVVPNPYDLTCGEFFKYTSGIGYQRADILEPGRGYWVKVNKPGSLILSSTPPPKTFARIMIIPTSELPPPPPDGNKEIDEIPKEFSLSEVYPNPFNPSTVIRYQLPVNSWATLKIYNLLGQEVTTLVDEFQDAGFKSVEWDAHEFASGIFFYKLSAERFVQVKKMILIR